CSIEDLKCAIRRKAGKKARHVVQERARIELTRTQGFLAPPAILDVRKEQIPRGYLVFCISHRETADLEPSVNAISATTTVLNLIDLPRFNGFLTRLDHAREVVWMNGADERPVLQLFTCSAEILKGLLVEKLYFSHCPRRGHEPGNVVDDLAPRE